MHYQIKYAQSGKAKRIGAVGIWVKYLVFILTAAAVCWSLLWSSGMDLPATAEALENMAVDLGKGANIKDAFSGFCLDILQGAENG